MIVFKSLINGSLLDPIGGNNGTLTAGVSRGFVQTDKGLALEFDGADTLVTCGDSTEIQNVFDGGGSAEAWINLKSSGESNAGRIVTKGGWTFYQGSASGIGSKLRLYQFFSGVDGWWETDDVTIIFNIWHHVIVTYDNSAVTNNPILYVNGVKYSVGDGLTEQATPVGTRTTDVGTDLTIGGGVGSDGTTDGNILNAQLYDHVLTTKERNELYANFLASSQIGQPKRGFTVQKPTDLSRYVDDTVGDNLIPSGIDRTWGTDVATEGTPYTNFQGAYTWVAYGSPTSLTVANNVLSIVAGGSSKGVKINSMAPQTGVRVTLTLNITAITGSWLYRCYDRTGGVWLDSITITTTGLKVLSFIAPSSNLEPTLTSSGSDTISIDAGSSENSFYPHSGLVAAYNMTLDTDGGVTDLTGNGNDGTNNGCLPSEDGLVFGGAEYVDLDALIPSISSNTIGSISTVITPKTSIPAANEQIISFSDTDVNERMQFWVGTDGKIYASCRVANVTKWTFATDNAVVSGLTNSTISLIHDGVSPILIIDGVEVPQTFSDSTDKTVWFSALTGLDNGRVGCNNLNGAGNDLFFNGQVLDVKIYNRALTAQEVIDYHNSFILPTLVETFDEGADGIAKLPTDWHKGSGTYAIKQINSSDTLPTYWKGIKLYDKYLECTVAGTIATLSGQAYGTWEWDMYKGADGNTMFTHFTNDNLLHDSGNDGYTTVFGSTEIIGIQKSTNGSRATIVLSATSALNINQWYHVKITRTKAGVMTIWIDGVLVVADSGSNPATDTDFPTSVFTVLDNDAGDRVANFTYKDEIQQ